MNISPQSLYLDRQKYTKENLIMTTTNEKRVPYTGSRIERDRRRRRVAREKRGKSIASSLVFIYTMITMTLGFVGCLYLVITYAKPDDIYGFLIWAIILGMVWLSIGGISYEYIREKIYKNDRSNF